MICVRLYGCSVVIYERLYGCAVISVRLYGCCDVICERLYGCAVICVRLYGCVVICEGYMVVVLRFVKGHMVVLCVI
jgi:hypothetical protein